MIEARTNNPGEVTQKNETPNTITVSMILEDLDNGIDRNGIKDKYGLQAWEVKQMFEHPTLKGKKPKRIKRLSFEFVDDTENAVDPNQTSIPVEEVNNAKIMEEAVQQNEEDFDDSSDEFEY